MQAEHIDEPIPRTLLAGKSAMENMGSHRYAHENVTVQPPSRSGGILAIVVTYKVDPATCPSLTTLLRSATALAGEAFRLRILVADNTPGGGQSSNLPTDVDYKMYTDNPGLAKPYNDALEVAEHDGFDWLLTLDQDTSLPVSFCWDILQVIRKYQDNQGVAAIVPRIMDGGRLISPFRFVGGFLPVVLPANAVGVASPHTSALNSASLLRVRALRELGGYDDHFPLHNSDTHLYWRLGAAGKHVAVARDVIVPHKLSILDRENRLLPARYMQMLHDECSFWDDYMGPAGRAERLIRLAVRYLKGVLVGEAAEFQRITQAEFWHRLLTRRSVRMLARTSKETL